MKNYRCHLRSLLHAYCTQNVKKSFVFNGFSLYGVQEALSSNLNTRTKSSENHLIWVIFGTFLFDYFSMGLGTISVTTYLLHTRKTALEYLDSRAVFYFTAAPSVPAPQSLHPFSSGAPGWYHPRCHLPQPLPNAPPVGTRRAQTASSRGALLSA